MENSQRFYTDIKGKINNINLTKKDALLPLFEVIINSIDAIEEAGIDLVNDGRIDVHITRHQLALPTSNPSEERPLPPISSFIVEDNGIGFNERNFESFKQAESMYKADRGGRGNGRFLWLKAFVGVTIESYFKEDGQFKYRSFQFTFNGVEDEEFRINEETKELRTKVKLFSIREYYSNAIPRELNELALRIVEHCLEYFILNKMPTVILHDPLGKLSEINLDNFYDALVGHSKRVEIKVKDYSFDLTHFLLNDTSGLSHRINYCADNRTVRVTNLTAKQIANLPPQLSTTGTNKLLIYAGYVSSSFLNERKNSQRTGFDAIPEDGLDLFDEIGWRDIEDPVTNAIQRFLEPYTETVREEKFERIRNYINESAPEYRFLLKNHSDKLDKFPPNISNGNLDTRLYQAQREVEIELRKQADILLNDKMADSDDYKKAWEDFGEYWESYNDVGKANLAKYIIHRKIVLNLLENALKRKPDGKYSKEDLIHKMIFPLRKFSDDLTYDDHNLWIIDERLSYHEYIASDVPFNEIEQLESHSKKRPDLLFFDKSFAVVEDESPHSKGVVIFEFKRPLRDDYTDDENPIEQVMEYVRIIKEDGKVKDKDGRPFDLPESTPFYCYIICDLTKKIRSLAKNTYDYTLTPDGSGYFGYQKNLGTYVEIISFAKLIGDAKKRNRILFEQLQLPERVQK